MTRNNTFSMSRIGSLSAQFLSFHAKLALTSIFGFCGIVFLILLLIQFFEGFRPQNPYLLFNLGMVLIPAACIICAGTSFPGLRSKEKATQYLMLPASAFEKFFVEFVGRILFIAVIPLVYWGVFNLEGYLVNFFSPAFSFSAHSLSLPNMHFANDTVKARMGVLFGTGGVLLFVIPFTGATVFERNPLIKTLFSVALIFFFNLFLVYFFLEVLHFNHYYSESPILFMRHMEDLLLALIFGSIVFNAGFLAAAYYKLKEREV